MYAFCSKYAFDLYEEKRFKMHASYVPFRIYMYTTNTHLTVLSIMILYMKGEIAF